MDKKTGIGAETHNILADFTGRYKMTYRYGHKQKQKAWIHTKNISGPYLQNQGSIQLPDA